MATVHVFISTGRFRSFDQLRAYIDQTYTADGVGVPSAFMLEVGLTRYEPGCIEAVYSTTGCTTPVTRLLAEASYSEQWLHLLDEGLRADAAVCVFAPNAVGQPEGCSLEYAGRYDYTGR